MQKYKGALIDKEDLGLWEGDVSPILDEASTVDIHWKGTKIPKRVILECLKWFRMVHAKYNSEAQARLLYNARSGEWSWMAYPQYVSSGLYSKEITTAELTEEQKKMREEASEAAFMAGFQEAGTIHSHCDAGAFASGTDDHDEITQNVVHITLGKINGKETVEIHGRVVFRKIKYPTIHWNEWMDECSGEESACWDITTHGIDDVSIDEEKLMALCFKRPVPQTTFQPVKSSQWPSLSNWGGCWAGWDGDDIEERWGDGVYRDVDKLPANYLHGVETARTEEDFFDALIGIAEENGYTIRDLLEGLMVRSMEVECLDAADVGKLAGSAIEYALLSSMRKEEQATL